MRDLIIYTVLCAILLSGCTVSEGGRMSFDDVTVIEKNALTESVEKGEDVTFPVTDVRNLRIDRDYIYIVGQNKGGFVTVFDKTDVTTPKGAFLHKGNGPGEVIFTPSLSEGFTIKGKDDCFSGIVFDDKNHIVHYDADLKGEEVKYDSRIILDVSFPKMCYIPVNDSTFFFRRIPQDQRTQPRFFMTLSGNEMVMPPMEILNKATVSVADGYMLNIMSSLNVYNPDNGIIVEACLHIPVINIYKTDGSFMKSIRIGKKRENIEALCKECQATRYVAMRDTFKYIRGYDDYFAVLYSGALSYSSDILGTRGPKPKLMLFDWNGNLLRNIQLPQYATSFEIDEDTDLLYLVDTAEGTVTCYPLTIDSLR